MRSKKAQATTLLVILLVVAGVFVVMNFDEFGSLLSVEDTGLSDEEVVQLACNVEDVTVNYNDLDSYKKGTDPSANMYVLSGDISPQSVNDDGTVTVPTNAEFTALAGENGSNYFTKLITVETGCSDPKSVAPELLKVGSATITLVNDDSATVNSDANHESMSASSTYTTEVTARAGADECISSENGLVIAIEYDATYFQEFESDLDDYDGSIYITHNSSGEGSQNSGLDQWATFMYDGAVCDNEKLEFIVTATTTSTEPTEDTNNVIWILPMDYDKDEDTLEPILGIYDEDNNLIAPSTVNATQFVA
jgi:hypothetical protein